MDNFVGFVVSAIIAVILAVIVVSLAGCKPPEGQKIEEVTRFEILSQQRFNNPRREIGITVVKDTTTQKEYMIVCSFEGVAVTVINDNSK